MNNLANKIEAILFALGRYVSFDEISNTLEIDKNEIKDAIQKLKVKFDDDESGIKLIYIKDGVQLVTNKIYYDDISKFIESSRKENLSPAAMETLTIIAYNPKITKSDIEKVRGVNSDFAVSKLLEMGLIEEVARLNLPGRPAVYSVSEDFLRSCNIKSVEELEDYDKMKIKDEQIMIDELKKEQ